MKMLQIWDLVASSEKKLVLIVWIKKKNQIMLTGRQCEVTVGLLTQQTFWLVTVAQRWACTHSPGALKPRQLNGFQPSLISLFTPVLSLLRKVKVCSVTKGLVLTCSKWSGAEILRGFSRGSPEAAALGHTGVLPCHPESLFNFSIFLFFTKADFPPDVSFYIFFWSIFPFIFK